MNTQNVENSKVTKSRPENLWQISQYRSQIKEYQDKIGNLQAEVRSEGVNSPTKGPKIDAITELEEKLKAVETAHDALFQETRDATIDTLIEILNPRASEKKLSDSEEPWKELLEVYATDEESKTKLGELLTTFDVKDASANIVKKEFTVLLDMVMFSLQSYVDDLTSELVGLIESKTAKLEVQQVEDKIKDKVFDMVSTSLTQANSNIRYLQAACVVLFIIYVQLLLVCGRLYTTRKN